MTVSRAQQVVDAIAALGVSPDVDEVTRTLTEFDVRDIASALVASAGGGGSSWLGPCKIGAFDGQYITSSQDFAGGAFTLTVNSEETAAIAFDANEAAIQTALEALPSIGAGHILVNCLGTNLTNGDAAVTFKDALATDLMTADVSGLTGGTPDLAISGAGAWTVEMFTPAEGDIIEDFMHHIPAAFDGSARLFYTDSADDPQGSFPIWAMPISAQGVDGIDLAVGSHDYTNFTGASGPETRARSTALLVNIAHWADSAAVQDSPVENYSNLPAACLNSVPIFSAVDDVEAAPTQGEVWIWVKVLTPAALMD